MGGSVHLVLICQESPSEGRAVHRHARGGGDPPVVYRRRQRYRVATTTRERAAKSGFRCAAITMGAESDPDADPAVDANVGPDRVINAPVAAVFEVVEAPDSRGSICHQLEAAGV